MKLVLQLRKVERPKEKGFGAEVEMKMEGGYGIQSFEATDVHVW